MNLAVFDLDHTLLDGDSDYLWGQFLVEQGLVDGPEYQRRNREFYLQYQAGTLDIQEFARFSMAPLAANDLALLQRMRAQFVETRILPCVAPGARPLLARHRAVGDTLLITTATNRFITEPIAALLGVEHLIATEPEMSGGRYTGRLAGVANYREGKVIRLREWLAGASQQYKLISCYSDSQNDLPLLEFAGHPCAVDPDAILRAEADKRGWPVISLRTSPG
jgi:HAD superfamily hydrolase (TIGR01490 family)